jgi:predicted MFS family arabinose efflux permease
MLPKTRKGLGREDQHPALIAGVFIAGFCVFLQLYSPQPLLVLFRDSFAASEAKVSLVIAASTLAVALFSPWVGFLADTLGRKRVVIPCLLALGILTVGCGMAISLNQLILLRFATGIFTPGVIAVILAYISEESAVGTALYVTTIYVTGTVLGGLTGRLSSAFMADHFSWRLAFVMLGVLTVVGALATWIFLPRSTRFQPKSGWKDALPTMLGHLKNKPLLATYFTGFNSLFCHVGLFTYANFHLAKPPFSLSTSGLGLIFLVYALGIVVTPLTGKLLTRIGHRRGGLIAIACICAGVLLTLANNLPIFILGLAISSTGIFIMQASASSHVGRAADQNLSAASGLYVSFYYLGGSVGATALAFPWNWGGWPAVVCTLILVQCISLPIVSRYFGFKASEAGFNGIYLD